MDALALLQFTTPAAQNGGIGTSRSSDTAGAFLQMIQSLTGNTPLMNGTPVNLEGVRVGEDGKPALTDETTMTAMSLLMSQFAIPMQPQTVDTVALTEGEAVEGIDGTAQTAAAIDPALMAAGTVLANGTEGESSATTTPAQTTSTAAIAEAAKSADDAAKLTVPTTQDAAEAEKTAETAQEPESVVKTLKREHAASAEADGAAINQEKSAEAKASKAETGSQNGHNNGNSFEQVLKAATNHTAQAGSSSTETSGTFASAVQGVSTDTKAQQAEVPTPSARQPQQPIPATLDTVSVHLHKAVASKTDRMTIQLRPIELGKIEVQLEFSPDGLVQASIAAERPETLELLQKDSRSLERALQDAGVQTNSNSLNFSLRGQGGNGGQGQFGQQAFGGNGAHGGTQDANPQGEDVTQAAMAALNKTDGGNRRLNITV